MSVTAVRLTLGRQDAEAFADALMETRCVSVSVSDAQAGTGAEKPIFGEPGADPGLWEVCEVVAHFPADEDRGCRSGRLRDGAGIGGSPARGGDTGGH